MTTALVTGGAGFIGSHVAEALLKLGKKVVVLDDLSGGFRDHVPAGVEFYEGSILDTQLLDKIFKDHKIDEIFHLAAYAAEGLSHFIKRFNYMNNLVGSVNLINLAVLHNVRCFVFTSSIAVYGKNQLPMTEAMTPEPEDPYGIAKFSVEQELKATHEMFGLDYIIFRPHNVYGEKQNIGDRYRNVIGIFMNNILQNQPLPIFGDGQQTRAFSYIGEVAPVIAASVDIAAARNQVFNVGADKPYTVLDLAETVCRVAQVKPNILHLPARNEVKHAYSSHEKSQKILGRGEPLDLPQGIERMWKWAKSAGARKSKRFENIEITRNLPPSWAQS